MNRESKEAQVASAAPKRQYRAPELTAFGRVAELTLSQTCTTAGDSNTYVICTPGSMSMGMA
jgi:hypothetical protein